MQNKTLSRTTCSFYPNRKPYVSLSTWSEELKLIFRGKKYDNEITLIYKIQNLYNQTSSSNCTNIKY